MKLPEINLPSQLPQSAAQRIYLALILTDYTPGSPVSFAQRRGRKLFNRGGGRLVSRDLKNLCSAGWLKAQQIDGTEAFAYSPGKRLLGNPRLHTEWRSFAAALFGKGGLVKKFINSSAWGHGVFGFNQTVVVGVLLLHNQGLRRADIVKYLQDFVGISSIDSALRKLLDGQIITHSKGLYTRHINWSKNIEIFLDSHMGGTARKERIAREVRNDRYKYANHCRLGRLNPKERRALLKNPCLRCGGKANQVEHYPPKKYGGYDHTHLVWAICKECNKKTKSFIQKLGPLPLFRGCVLAVKKGLDANVLLRTSLVHDLRHFYKAAERRDYATGIRVVHKSLQFINDLETLELLKKRPTRRLVNKRGARSVKGRNPIVRESSRKKYSR